MYIRRLELFNFGVYAGKNKFVFTGTKPIVLIGGMNGHGKTTFLEAILLSLYGSNSPAFKEQRKTYSSYLKSFVNKSDGTLISYVLLDFEISSEERYEIKRLWTGKKQCTEILSVKRNGKENDFLASNWPMFIENLLPNALSKFFFFDGEKIAEMSIDENNTQVKESIKALLGINVLDTLESDLLKNLRKYKTTGENSTLEKEIERLREEKKGIEKEYIDIQKKVQIMNQDEIEIRNRIEDLRHQYAIQGGDAISKRQDLIQNKALRVAEYESVSEKLINIASSILPLNMIKNTLLDIKLQATDDKYNRVVRESIKMIEEKAILYSKGRNESKYTISDFINFLKKDIQGNNSDIYNLSDHALYQLNQLTEIELSEEKYFASSLINQKIDLNNRLIEISSYLSLDINERELKELLDSIDKEETKLEDVKNDLKELNEVLHEVSIKFQRISKDLNNKVEIYLSEIEISDDDARRKKYSNMALLILKKYKTVLQKNKAQRLAETITNCYKKLSTKKNLIDQIVINPETLDFIYISTEKEEIKKNRLSAGEKQLVVISTLWALAICSEKKLPVIIDTPLARLDSKHRESIVKKYFPNASPQTMILSTDSEIYGDYYNMMKDSIGDEYTLEYDENTRSTSVKKGYKIGGLYAD